MNPNAPLRRICVLVLTLCLLSTGVACSETSFLSGVLSFGVGLVTGSVSRLTTTTCYRNGVLIDCSELPEFDGG